MCFGKKSAPPTSAVVDEIRPADDFAIIQQFNQLYMKVRAWSSEFLGGDKPALPPDLEPQIQRIVLHGTLSQILNERTLHRHVIEGLVGVSISETLNPQVLRFATTKTPAKQLKTDLHTVFQLATSLQRAFQTQQNATFTVSFPRVTAGNPLDFNTAIMEDRGRTNGTDAMFGVNVVAESNAWGQDGERATGKVRKEVGTKEAGTKEWRRAGMVGTAVVWAMVHRSRYIVNFSIRSNSSTSSPSPISSISSTSSTSPFPPLMLPFAGVAERWGGALTGVYVGLTWWGLESWRVDTSGKYAKTELVGGSLTGYASAGSSCRHALVAGS
ncbi:hypothetical protein K440DRAFT_643058 [Wilcoxina mikolae CBS 423.85]|nr:hypothetical protein K440DRAFT_643058 [Wilcoxina mikolae CBS 423.85]